MSVMLSDKNDAISAEVTTETLNELANLIQDINLAQYNNEAERIGNNIADCLTAKITKIINKHKHKYFAVECEYNDYRVRLIFKCKEPGKKCNVILSLSYGMGISIHNVDDLVRFVDNTLRRLLIHELKATMIEDVANEMSEKVFWNGPGFRIAQLRTWFPNPGEVEKYVNNMEKRLARFVRIIPRIIMLLKSASPLCIAASNAALFYFPDKKVGLRIVRYTDAIDIFKVDNISDIEFALDSKISTVQEYVCYARKNNVANCVAKAVRELEKYGVKADKKLVLSLIIIALKSSPEQHVCPPNVPSIIIR